MSKYEIVHMDSNKNFKVSDDETSNTILEMINSYTEECYDEFDRYGRFHSIIPIFDEYGLNEAYFIFSDDEPLYDLVISTKDEKINKKLIQHYLDIVLRSNILVIDEKKYRILNVITDISNSSQEIELECEQIE